MKGAIKHQPTTVTSHLTQLGTMSFPSYLSMGKLGMIIEGGTGPTTDIIVEQLDYLQVDPKRIRYIILTHTHADHIGAVPRLRQRWPHIKILAGPIAAKFLQRENFVKEFLPSDRMIGNLLLNRGDIQEMPPLLNEYPFEADAVVDEGDIIDLGDAVAWQVFSTPGHSPCHLSLFEEKERTLAMGDMTGFFDPENDVFWPNYFQSLETYCDSIRKMASVPAERALLSHNGVIQGDSRIHLERALRATEAYHRELLNRLDRGEGKEDICNDKADFVFSLGALASYRVIAFLCSLMLKHSQKERGKQLFDLDQAEAA